MYKNIAHNNIKDMSQAELSWDYDTASMHLAGIWQWATINEQSLFKLLDQFTNQVKNNPHTHIRIDASNVQALDTAGVYFINKIIHYLSTKKIIISQLTLNQSIQSLYDKITATLKSINFDQTKQSETDVLSLIGKQTLNLNHIVIQILVFFGQFCCNLFNLIKAPLRIEWSEAARTVQNAGIQGLWVTSLLGFLIGVTLAYEMAPQFITYGANIYIVNFLGISLLKEVTPLLTAIIVAGRTGSAITAEISVMKVEEEIDALETMGISPINRLVLPKVIGTTIATPLITAIADIASLLGGAIVANNYLGVTYSLFLSRLQTYVSINNYKAGILKSIFFAIAISLIGCYCGFNVKGNANSIGEQTTKSVVWGIIAILFLDAVFAIIFKTIQW